MTAQSNGLDAIYHNEWVKAELAYVRQIIQQLLAEEARHSPLVADALANLTAASGKMLRPLLVLFGARAGSAADYTSSPPAAFVLDKRILLRQTGNYLRMLRSQSPESLSDRTFQDWKTKIPVPGALPNRIYLLAAALEILHLATLVHDDVIDESPLRRGLPSARQLIGDRQAVLLGDLLLTLCFALVNDSASPEDSKGQTGLMLAAMVRLMVRSEFLQASDRAGLAGVIDAPSLRHYIRVISGKTALLFALSLSSGASECKANPPILDALRRAGYNLGLAFQIKDDLLDYQLGNQCFGKPCGQDLRDGQISIPTIAALRNRDSKTAGARAELKQLLLDFHAGDETCFDRIHVLIEQLGGFSQAIILANQYLERARLDLAEVAKSQKIANLGQMFNVLVEFFAARDY